MSHDPQSPKDELYKAGEAKVEAELALMSYLKSTTADNDIRRRVNLEVAHSIACARYNALFREVLAAATNEKTRPPGEG